MSVDERKIIPIQPAHLVGHGGLVVISGDSDSGKTAVAECMFHHSIGSFLETRYPPLYIGSNASTASRYFRDLFPEYLSPYQGDRMAVMSKSHIMQLGHQYLCEQMSFREQGQDFLDSRLSHVIQVLSSEPLPRIVLYFDNCDDELEFVGQCLEPTRGKHRQTATINVVETTHRALYANLNPNTIVFTSLLVKRDETTLQRLLECTHDVAVDLVKTANSFIRPKEVALVVALDQWRSTKQRRGLHILHYRPVPSLSRQLRVLRAQTRPPPPPTPPPALQVADAFVALAEPEKVSGTLVTGANDENGVVRRCELRKERTGRQRSRRSASRRHLSPARKTAKNKK